MSTTSGAVEVRAPARIDLAGGTIDIWPICLIEPGAVTVNLAIDRFARAWVRRRDDTRTLLQARDLGLRERHDDPASLAAGTALGLHREIARHVAPAGGIEIATRSGVPPGSGLGGSSTLFVAAFQAALAATGKRLAHDRFLRTVIDMEARLIGVPTGAQDYLPAMHGGLSVIRYPEGGPRRRALRTDVDAVARRLVLVYTGVPHDSATNNWEITKAYLDGDTAVRSGVTAIATAAAELEAALGAGDLDAAGAAIDREWTARKQLAPGVTTPTIERLGKRARAAGAQAMKVCGAGGGGCVFFWCAEGRKAAVTRAAREAGARVLAFRPARAGAR